MENARRPIDYVRDHAVFELPREERAQLFLFRRRVIVRQNNRMKTRIPEPLIRVVILRRLRVYIPARRTAIFLHHLPRLTSDIHSSSISSVQEGAVRERYLGRYVGNHVSCTLSIAAQLRRDVFRRNGAKTKTRP